MTETVASEVPTIIKPRGQSALDLLVNGRELYNLAVHSLKGFYLFSFLGTSRQTRISRNDQRNPAQGEMGDWIKLR